MDAEDKARTLHKWLSEPVTLGGEHVQFVAVNIRTRARRALRWPLMVLRYRRIGVSWLTAFRLTHWLIWYQVDGRRR